MRALRIIIAFLLGGKGRELGGGRVGTGGFLALLVCSDLERHKKR